MSVLPIGFGSEEGGYRIERSLRFNSSDSAFLNRTPASAGNRKTWTWSAWVKRSALGTQQLFFDSFFGDLSRYCLIRFNDTNVIQIFGGVYTTGASTTVSVNLSTAAVFRDVSAWYHIVLAYDTTQATDTNRVKIYVNGVLQTISGTYPSQNEETYVNATNVHAIGRYSESPGQQYLNGYLTEINFIDGLALDPSYFGFTDANGIWQPRAYKGAYGTNGFFLNFSDNSGVTSTTLGKDYSGNGNNWTPNNFSVTAGAGNDSLVDTPTNYGVDTGAGGEVRGNYATLNPLDTGTNITFSNGNLQVLGTNSPNNNCRGTFGMSSGKWYFEMVITSSPTTSPGVGIASASASLTTNFSGDLYVYLRGGDKVVNGTESAYGASYTQNDVIGVAFDADSNSITFYKNNASQGTITGVTSGLTWRPFVHAARETCVLNFGQRPFAYTAPSGFKALCTQNLPEPTIVDGGEYFNTVLYTGNGSTQSITGVGFQPDWTWVKARSQPYSHAIVDSVRGVSRPLRSNGTDAEYFESGKSVYQFNSDGFSVSEPTGFGSVNENTTTYVAWNWKANGAGVSNTDGTITSTVSANTDSGFSIVTYTGTGANATVGHGLGVAPRMMIVKQRSGGAQDWAVYHASLGATQSISLNTTGAAYTVATNWNNTAPTSTVFSVGSRFETNESGATFVAYVFAAIPGYSAFGSYTGNGSADGPMIFTNFRPAFLLIKNVSAAEPWIIFDSARNTYNFVDAQLRPSESSAENPAGSSFSFDFLSNGFKVRSSASAFNGSGNTMIYAAFAENPFKYSLAR
jgi:hypothetical protein